MHCASKLFENIFASKHECRLEICVRQCFHLFISMSAGHDYYKNYPIYIEHKTKKNCIRLKKEKWLFLLDPLFLQKTDKLTYKIQLRGYKKKLSVKIIRGRLSYLSQCVKYLAPVAKKNEINLKKSPILRSGLVDHSDWKTWELWRGVNQKWKIHPARWLLPKTTLT